MPRRVNNLFKIHKAKLVPSVRLGALVELHQRWIRLRCAPRQPQLHAQEMTHADLACGNDESRPPTPPLERQSTAQSKRGERIPATQGQDNCIFHLFCCVEL